MDAPPKGRREDGALRQFQWFTPARRRATLYEDVTIDTQPSVHRHLDRGWPVNFEDGRTTWSDDSTAIRVADWYDFRDPGEQWERPFYQAGAGIERQIENAVRTAVADRLFEDFSPAWVEFLRANLQVPAFVEHGLWFATAIVARDCLSDSLAHAVVLQAALKQRLAQSIVLYAMDLEPHFGPMPMETARERFLTVDTWQPTRRYLEALRTRSDWVEVLVASNLAFEPLVGVLLRRELGVRAARANGDSVTPVLAQAGQLEYDWIRSWTAALMHLVLDDAEHGAANRDAVAGWLGAWVPEARAAAQALAGLAGELPTSIDLEEAMERVERDARAGWAAAGVGELLP